MDITQVLIVIAMAAAALFFVLGLIDTTRWAVRSFKAWRLREDHNRVLGS